MVLPFVGWAQLTCLAPRFPQLPVWQQRGLPLPGKAQFTSLSPAQTGCLFDWSGSPAWVCKAEMWGVIATVWVWEERRACFAILNWVFLAMKRSLEISDLNWAMLSVLLHGKVAYKERQIKEQRKKAHAKGDCGRSSFSSFGNPCGMTYNANLFKHSPKTFT